MERIHTYSLRGGAEYCHGEEILPGYFNPFDCEPLGPRASGFVACAGRTLLLDRSRIAAVIASM